MTYKVVEKERDIQLKLELKEIIDKIEKNKINFSIINLKKFVNLQSV